MPTEDLSALLKSASEGISQYLADARRSGRIDEQSYQQAMQNTLPNLKDWLTDEHLPAISPGLRGGLCDAIAKGEWEKLVNAFRERARFGTGGIRGMMAFDRPSIERLKQEGIAAPILSGPNTINDVVLLADLGRRGQVRPGPEAALRQDGHRLRQPHPRFRFRGASSPSCSWPTATPSTSSTSRCPIPK